MIINNNGNKEHDKSYQGFVFETISIILILVKCISVDFSNILIGKFEEYNSLLKLRNVLDLLDTATSKGDDKSDLTLLTYDNNKIAFSMKYRNNEKADNEKLGLSILMNICKEHDKLGLIVKDKSALLNHKYTTDSSVSKETIKNIHRNNLLFDENDIITVAKDFKKNIKKIY